MKQNLNHSSFPTLSKNLDTHILIIGGGLCGIQLAYYLHKINEDALLIDEQQVIPFSDSFPLLTAQQGYLYHPLSTRYDKFFAKLYYHCNQDTLNDIESIIHKHNIDCNFKRCDSIMYANNIDDLVQLENEYKCYQDLQIPCTFHTSSTQPSHATLTMHYQASFHPIQYINGLLSEIPEFPIYENCNIQSIKEDSNGYFVHCNGYTIHTDQIVFINPTSNPFLNSYYHQYIFQQELHIKNAQSFSIPINYEQPFYAPVFQNQTLSTQTTFDHVPFIGKIYKDNENLLFVHGCSIWDSLLACLSAKLLLSHILRKHNIYRFLFSPQRVDFCKNAFKEQHSIIL